MKRGKGIDLVVKLGGAAGLDPGPVCEDVALLRRQGMRLVLVHGGSAETDRLAEALGRPPQLVTSVSGHVSRRTDRRTLEIFVQATALVNRLLVERLQGLGVCAFGLSGIDGRVVAARRKEAIRVVENGRTRILRGEWTGTPEKVDAELMHTLAASGRLPVLAPLGLSGVGEMLNCDGDRVAACVAAALGAPVLVILSNVPGLLREPDDPGSLVRRVGPGELDAVSGSAQGRMRKKLLGAAEALNAGVLRVVLADGRRMQPVRAALRGEGTVITGVGQGRVGADRREGAG